MTDEAKFRKQQYISRYQKETYTNISFKLRTKEDGEIISLLKSLPNKSDYIKELIKADMMVKRRI